MMRYLRLFFNLMRYNLVRELEYRAHFLLGVMMDLFWVALQLIVIEMYFKFTDNIAGWTKAETLILMGIFRVVKGIFDVYFRPNLFALSQAISRGELDYIITKPVNTLFLVSLKRHQFNQAGTALMGVGILAYAFQISTFSFNLTIFSQLILSIVFGLVVFYSAVLAFSTLSIYITRLSAISAYYDVLSNLLRYPTDALGYHTGLISALLLPLAVVATLPAKLVLGKVPETQLFFEAVLSIGIFSVTYLFWNFSLRRYSSASS